MNQPETAIRHGLGQCLLTNQKGDIRAKETFGPIAAARNHIFVGCVGFAIPKRKKLVGLGYVVF
jgi:hypothetical protein